MSPILLVLGFAFIVPVPQQKKFFQVARARDFLTKEVDADEVNEVPQISAEAFHTRLVDSASSRIRVEVFQVKFQKDGCKIHSLLGLRDFTDVASISIPVPSSPGRSVWGDDCDDDPSRLRQSMNSVRSLVLVSISAQS